MQINSFGTHEKQNCWTHNDALSELFPSIEYQWTFDKTFSNTIIVIINKFQTFSNLFLTPSREQLLMAV